MRKPASFVAVLVFWIVALLHVLRLVFGVQIVVGETGVPVWTSITPVVFFGLLGAWLWSERRL